MTDTILIWGAGAIGGSLGAAFIRAGHDVLFVDQASDHVDAINARGLTITGPMAPGTVPARAVRPAEVHGPFRACILAVKAHHTPGAIAALAPHLASDGFVVSAQNGLNERAIAEAVGRERTVGCFVNFGADYLEPGIVLHGGRGAVVVGELDGALTERLAEIHTLFQSFDPAAIATQNIWGFLWGKLVYGTQLFATALTDDSIADVFATPAFRPVITALSHEVIAAARAEGIARLERFDGFDPAAFMPEAAATETEASYDAMVAHNRKSAKSHSGIWRDLAVRKRRTEVDAQVGAVVAVARQHGVPTPLLARLVAMIHEIEEGCRPLSRDNLAALAREAA